jgi:hypothetical protein
MSVDDLLRCLGDDPDLGIEVRDGIEDFREGEITLRLAGTGMAEVVHRRSGREEHYREPLGSARARALGQELADLGVGELEPNDRTRNRDETELRFAVTRGDEVLYEVELPHNDRWENPALQGLIERYEATVEDVTDGALPWGEAAAPR